MKIVVSGATGFLGGHLTERLVADGHDVIGLGRNPEAGQRLAKLGARFVFTDLARGPGGLGEETADAFVHAAALSSNWGRRADFHAVNVTGTANALAMARRLRVRRFVQISTPSLYFRFADQLAVKEDAPLPVPVNAYAWSKAEAEALVRDAGDMGIIILRPRGLYGPGDVALLPRLVRAAGRGPLPLLREGRAVTDLTFVDDAVDAICAALLAGPLADGRVFNISGGQALPVRRIAELAAAKAGIAVRWRAVPVPLALAAARLAEAAGAILPGQPEPLVTAYSLGVLAFSQTLDITRARDILGWQPRIDFAEGLGRS